MARVGGKSVNEVVRRILKLCFSQDFLLKVNRPGTFDKVAFLPLEPVVKGTLRL